MMSTKPVNRQTYDKYIQSLHTKKKEPSGSFWKTALAAMALFLTTFSGGVQAAPQGGSQDLLNSQLNSIQNKDDQQCFRRAVHLNPRNVTEAHEILGMADQSGALISEKSDSPMRDFICCVVKGFWKSLSTKLHPDKNPKTPELATEASKNLNGAKDSVFEQYHCKPTLDCQQFYVY